MTRTTDLAELAYDAVCRLMQEEIFWHDQEGIGPFAFSARCSDLIRKARKLGVQIGPTYNGFDIDKPLFPS